MSSSRRVEEPFKSRNAGQSGHRTFTSEVDSCVTDSGYSAGAAMAASYDSPYIILSDQDVEEICDPGEFVGERPSDFQPLGDYTPAAATAAPLRPSIESVDPNVGINEPHRRSPELVVPTSNRTYNLPTSIPLASSLPTCNVATRVVASGQEQGGSCGDNDTSVILRTILEDTQSGIIDDGEGCGVTSVSVASSAPTPADQATFLDELFASSF